jgi:Mn-dependent DtxR family transcriptional regulator
MKNIYKIIGKFRRQKTDNETLEAIKSLSKPASVKSVSKKLGIKEESTLKRIRRLEMQGKVYIKSKNNTNRYLQIYLDK